MANLDIVRLGFPSLREPARPVPAEALAGAEVQELIDGMVEAMRRAGGVGLAAPQVGLGWQIFVYEFAPEGGEPEGGAIPLRAVINPMVEPEGGELVYDWEGCLSIPDLRGLVPRHPEVRVHAVDRHGQPLSYTASGFEARIIQHEFDHLNGVVFLDRMRDLKSLAFEEEWQELMAQAPGQAEPATVG